MKDYWIHVGDIALPSERTFGRSFAILLAGAAGYLWWSNSTPGATFCAMGAIVMFALAQVAPRFLRWPNRAWFALGIVLGKLVSPVVLGAIFFLLITPVAIVGRLCGRDELRLKVRRASRPSYWIDRIPPGPAGGSFRRPF